MQAGIRLVVKTIVSRIIGDYAIKKMTAIENYDLHKYPFADQ